MLLALLFAPTLPHLNSIPFPGDLIKFLKWPLGSVIAQGCHATTAVNHLNRDDPETIQYFADLDNMHKVVLMVYEDPFLVPFYH